jgi:hypothetical protein
LGMELRSVVDRNGHVPYYADMYKMYLVAVRCAVINYTRTSIFTLVRIGVVFVGVNIGRDIPNVIEFTQSRQDSSGII